MRAASRRPKIDETTYYSAPSAMVKLAFGRKLREARIKKGWSMSELARRASKIAGPSFSIGKYSISRYEIGAQMPEPPRVRAMAAAMDIKPEDLRPDLESEPIVPARGLDAQVNAETGMVWLRLNQAVSLGKAQRIMAILAEKDEQPG